MTDHDAIAPTNDRFMGALRLFSNLLRHYCKHEFTNVSGALPFRERTPEFIDLLSAPDIVAGSVEHYFTRSDNAREDVTISAEADQVLRWLTGQGIALKRHVMIIRAGKEGPVSGTLRFQLKRKDPNAIFIPVVAD
jgi:hypothetical protein